MNTLTWLSTRRIGVAFIISAFVSLGVCLASLYALRWVINANQTMHSRNIDSLVFALRLDTEGEKEAAAARSYLLTGNEDYLRQMSAANTLFHQYHHLAAAITTMPEGRHLLAELHKRENEEQESLDRVILLKEQGRSSEINRAFILEDLKRKYEAIDQAAEAYIAHIQRQVDESQERLGGASARLVRILLLVGTVVLLLGVLLSRGLIQALSRIRQSEADLQEALRARDEFLSVASHELKNPLTALQLRLQLLQDSVPPSHKNGVAACIQLSGRLTGLLNELLDLTRIRAGRVQLRPEPMDLTEVARELVTQSDAAARKAGTELRFVGGPVTLGEWDRMRIEQVVANLVSNAVKYGERRPVEVSTGVNPAGGTAWLRVEDHGMGIAPEMQERIFERFERAVPGDHRIRGLGLGLYIVRQLIEAHGGTIRVESEPGKGSAFTVELPLKGNQSMRKAG